MFSFFFLIEATYAKHLSKIIIPCRMELEYRPEGWLGFLIGEKLYFDFAGKDPFKKTMDKLLWEIKGQLGMETSQTQSKSCQKISEDVSVNQMKKKIKSEIHMKDHTNSKASSRGVAKTGMI